jgi:hypothetical protein
MVNPLVLYRTWLTNNSFAFSDGNLKVLNANDFSILKSIFTEQASLFKQSSDGSVISTWWGELWITFYNTLTGTEFCSFNLTPQKQENYNMSIGIAPSNDRFVAQLSNNNKFTPPSLFNITNGKFIKSLPAAANVAYYGLQFSADGKKLVGAYAEGNRLKLRVWNFQ